MKETIYTIPISEIFEEEAFCPFCSLEKRLNDEEIKYTLGPAMMEPDYRILTNEKGFCKRHTAELNTLPKALPLALVIKSRLAEIENIFEAPEKEKRKLFSSKGKTPLDILIEKNEAAISSCVICERIKKNIDRYFDTFADMVKDSANFFERVSESDGFCMPHFSKALSSFGKRIKGEKLYDAVSMICAVQKRKFKKYSDDVSAFAESFDYKNAGKPCPVPNDTVLKSCYFMSGEFTPLSKKLEDI